MAMFGPVIARVLAGLDTLIVPFLLSFNLHTVHIDCTLVNGCEVYIHTYT